MLDALAAWMRSTPVHTFMVQNPVAFTAAETLHFMALTVLFGALLVVDLRGMGLLRRISLIDAHKLVPFAIGAFAVNLVTGVAFMFSNPENYFDNRGFQLKILLILIAGLNAAVFELLVFKPLLAGRPGVDGGAVVRISSALSLLLWAGVLIFGRLIPYT